MLLGRLVELDNGVVNYFLCYFDFVDESGVLYVFLEVEEGEELVLMEGSIFSFMFCVECVINNVVMLLFENRKFVGVLMIYCVGCCLMVGDEINFMLNLL